MGFWGYKLYENDTACDVKDLFLKYLHEFEFDCDKATRKLLSEFKEECEDEDASLVWTALADTQWNKGILLDFVKENALKFINSEIEGERLIEYNINHEKRCQHLNKLKAKLLSEQPAAKKPRIKKNFICDWKIGDTFAYKLTSEYSLEKGLFNRYLVFHKIGEVDGYPADIFPVVWVKYTENDRLPTCKEDVDALNFIQISTVSECHPSELQRQMEKKSRAEIQREIAKKSNIVSERDDFGYIPNYRIALSFTSKRNIPKEMLYLGNFELLPPKINYKNYKDEEVQQILWKFAEEIIIDRYIAFNLRKSPLYNY